MNRHALLLLALISITALSGAAPLGAQQPAATPSVFDVSPTHIANGTDAEITITGVGFVDPPVVTLSQCGLKPLLLTDTRLATPTTIKASVPQATPEGVYQLTVYNPDGASSGASAIALTVVRPADQHTSAWRMTSPLAITRYEFAAVAAASNLYVIGGYSGGGFGDGLRSVLRAVIGVDGELGAWQPAPPLTNGRGDFAATTGDGYIYVIGGAVAVGFPRERTVERALINPDGSLGEWQIVSELPEIRYRPAAVQVGEYLLVIDGRAGSTDGHVPADTLQAHIAANQTIEPWIPTRGTIGETRHAVAVGTAVYALNSDGSIERTTMGEYGILASWQPVAPTAIPHVDGALAAMGEWLFVIGGVSGSEQCPIALNTVERARIHADGSLGPWEPAPSLRAGRYPVEAAAWGHQIYAIGGEEVWNTEYNIRAGKGVEVATDLQLTERLYLPLLGRPRP